MAYKIGRVFLAIACSVLVMLFIVFLAQTIETKNEEVTEIKGDGTDPLWRVSDGYRQAQVHRFIDDAHQNVCYVAVGPSGVGVDCLPLNQGE